MFDWKMKGVKEHHYSHHWLRSPSGTFPEDAGRIGHFERQNEEQFVYLNLVKF